MAKMLAVTDCTISNSLLLGKFSIGISVFHVHFFTMLLTPVPAYCGVVQKKKADNEKIRANQEDNVGGGLSMPCMKPLIDRFFRHLALLSKTQRYAATGTKYMVCIAVSGHVNATWRFNNCPAGRAVTRSSLEREVRGSNFGPVKSDTVLPTARHRCDISCFKLCYPGAMTRKWASQTRCTLRRNAAIIKKHLILI